MKINCNIRRHLKSFFRITLKQIGLQNEALPLAEWVCDRHMEPLNLADLHRHLNEHQAFSQVNLWKNHKIIYLELGKKVMSSHNVLHGYRQVSALTKTIAEDIFSRLAKYNNKDHNLVNREVEVEWIRTVQLFDSYAVNALPGQVSSALNVVNSSTKEDVQEDVITSVENKKK